MNDVIKAYEVTPGFNYRLFPNSKRSRYLVVKALGVSIEKRPLFLYTDPKTKAGHIINNVGLLENVQLVSKHV